MAYDGSGSGGTPPPPPPPPPGSPPPPPYGGARPAATGPNNGMAIAALCCGIFGFFCLVTAPLGIIFGFVAKNQIRDSGYTQRGDGMATAGIVCGILALVLFVVVLALGGVDFNTN